MYHERIKHIEIDYHFIGELIQDGTTVISYVSIKKQLTYIFTESFGSTQFQSIVDLIKLNATALYISTHLLCKINQMKINILQKFLKKFNIDASESCVQT